MLVTSIFSFSYNVFYPSQNKLQFLSNIDFVVCKINAFNLDQSTIFSFDKDLNLPDTSRTTIIAILEVLVVVAIQQSRQCRSKV